MEIQELIKLKESPGLDFKREFHDNNADLLHDILCLCNAEYDGDRFLVFGIGDDRGIHGIDNDKNLKTNANIHDFLRSVHINRLPKVELTTHTIESHTVAVLRITNEPYKPFFLNREYVNGGKRLHAGSIYTRFGDTNVPSNESAREAQVEVMWKERWGLGLLPQLETTFPIKLNDTKERVHEILGDPTDTGYLIEHFYSDGLEVSFDQHTDLVDGLVVYPLPNGVAFEGTVFGVRLGDRFARAKEVLGRPDYWGFGTANSSMAIWDRGDQFLILEIWKPTHRDAEGNAGQFGTIRAIIYCNKKSYVGYNAVAIITVEQIKRGQQPEYFEREDIFLDDIDLKDEVFHQSYVLGGGQPATFGGSQVYLNFETAETLLVFWIYPLNWSYPVVRSIRAVRLPTKEADSADS